MSTRPLISFNPDTFVEGGLVDDVDMFFKEAVFCLYDYNGKVAESVLALGIKMVDPEGKEYDQYYSAGDKKYFVPSEDGKTLIPTGDKAGLNSNTNAAKLFKSLLDAGFPVAQLNTGNLRAIEGGTYHMVRVAQAERKGLVKNAKKEGPDTVLLVTKVVALPGEAKAPAAATPKPTLGAPNVAQVPMAAPAAAPVAATPAPAPANGSADLDAMLTPLVIQVVGEAGGSIAKGLISQAVFKKAQSEANTKPFAAQLVARVFKDDYLASLAGAGLLYDGTTIKMGA